MLEAPCLKRHLLGQTGSSFLLTFSGWSSWHIELDATSPNRIDETTTYFSMTVVADSSRFIRKVGTRFTSTDENGNLYKLDPTPIDIFHMKDGWKSPFPSVKQVFGLGEPSIPCRIHQNPSPKRRVKRCSSTNFGEHYDSWVASKPPTPHQKKQLFRFVSIQSIPPK